MASTTYLRAAALGASSGLRSMTGPAAAVRAVGGRARPWLTAAALGELVADKLPIVPARTIPPALIVRAGAGGYAASLVAGRGAADRRIAFALGAAAAIGASYLGLRLRRAVAERTGLPDPLVALAEDLLAIGVASLALSRTN